MANTVWKQSLLVVLVTTEMIVDATLNMHNMNQTSSLIVIVKTGNAS